MDLTLIVIPIHDVNDDYLDTVARSMGIPVIRLGYHLDRDFNVQVNTGWKMFLFGNEYLSPVLMEAIPIFLDYPSHWDYFSFYKSVMEGTTRKYYIAPRIFKSGVEMLPLVLMPVNINGLNGITILNDFLRNFEDVANTGSISYG